MYNPGKIESIIPIEASVVDQKYNVGADEIHVSKGYKKYIWIKKIIILGKGIRIVKSKIY